MNYYTKQTIIGKVTITEEKGFITSLNYGNYKGDGLHDKNSLSEILEQAFHQLEEYFSVARKTFDLPLNPKGTPFQQKVWSCLYKIPYGEMRTYKDIAEQIGDKNACRAVGNANNKNPIPIFIPCHRVISSDSSIGGYSGGLDIKTKLLKIEGIVVFCE